MTRDQRSGGKQRPPLDTAQDDIRKDSHLALALGFGFALLVVGTLVAVRLVGA